MKKSLLAFLIFVGSNDLSHACSQFGYVGWLNNWMKGGYAYMLEAGLYDYIGGTETGIIRIVSFPRSSQTPTNNLEDKKDTKVAKEAFEKAFNEYLRLYMYTSESGSMCVANTGQEFHIRYFR